MTLLDRFVSCYFSFLGFIHKYLSSGVEMRYLTIAGHRGNYKSLNGKVDRSPPDRDTCHDLGASIFINFVFFLLLF